MREPGGEGSGTGSLLHRGRAAGELAWQAQPAAVAGSLVVVLLMGTAPVATAWLTKLVLDGLAGDGGRSVLLPLAAALGVAGLALVVLPHVSEYLTGQLHRGLQRLIYDRLFRAVNADPGLSRFENPSFHDELRLAHEAGQNAPQQIVGSSLAICQGLLTLLGFMATLTVLSPVMVVIVIAAALPSARVQLALSRRRARTMWGISSNTRRQIFFSALLTSPDAAKEVRLFGLGDFLRTRMLTELKTVNEAERDLDRRTLRSQGLLSLLGAAVAAGGLFWAVLAATAGGLSVGDVSVFVAAVAGVQTALTSIVGQWASAHNALLMFGHYLGVVQADPGLPVPAEPTALPPLREGIELRDVWFRYDDEHPWVLRGVDLFIPHGQAVALVGLNGAGKSTLVKLLCRLYDPVRGSIHWDGVDLRDMRPADLRERIGVVFQDYMSYDLTAGENIMLGDLAAGADPELVRTAARRAGIHDTLADLPKGYDTLLSRIFFGDDEDQQAGVVLSGGQWQRLALARALMRHHRDLLILDEPSSGLDAEAEHAVHLGLRRHRAGRTSVLISHRLGALREADLIVVLSEGKIAERGSHRELVALGGEYARLFALQASGYEPTSAVPAEGSMEDSAEESMSTAAPGPRPAMG
ncbi:MULTISPECIES: ABC transporter ATP-binding protein [Streptosporangium]|uniref:ATP-binding cassette subfamily B protein n=1 Tax=Streptosporangium brasiliense TaxID=47480 RepID=A0ABT9R3C1_9ACTN|nr:ABC transporter ATP-binding protein [Streptosporangium brasiliense]MDP9863717.1 ATP-binding cassette subfamily B protein [Streptosporangium brasiliense]